MRLRIFGVLLLVFTILIDTAVAREDTSSLLKLAREASKNGDFAASERFHRLALDAAERSGDPIQRAEAIGDLGGLFLAQGRLKESRELCLQSLALLRENKSNRYMPVVLNNLGVISMHRGEYRQSEAFFKEALQTVRSFPNRDPYEARVLNNLGAFYYTVEDLGKAEDAFTKAVAVMERFGSDRNELVPFLGNLGGVYVRRKKWEKAEALFNRALLLLRNAEATDDLKAAGILDNLGVLHHVRKNFDEAQKSLRRAWEIRLARLGPEHPLVVVTAVKLAGALREIGRFRQAEDLYNSSLAIYEKTARLQTVEGATALEELAHLFRQTHRETSAVPLEAKARAIRFNLQNTVAAPSLR